MIALKISTIQLREDTKKKLESKKVHPRESYNAVLQRMLDYEDIPSMEEMFKRGDSLKHRKYSTEEIIRMSHRLREKR